jgi:hypothetical protein
VLGGVLLVLLALAVVLANYLLFNPVFSSPLFSIFAQGFYLRLAFYFLSVFILYLAFLISVLKSETQVAGKNTKAWKISFAVSLIFVIASLSLPGILLNDTGFSVIPQVSGTLTVAMLLSSSLYGVESPSYFAYANLVATLVLALGSVLIIGFGIRRGLRLKEQAYVVKVLAIFIVAIVALYLLSNSLLSHYNQAALNGLNSRLSLYGANMRYFVTNSSLMYYLFPPDNYSNVLKVYNATGATSIQDLKSVLGPSLANTTLSESQNWETSDPAIGAVTFYSLLSLGVLNSASGAPQTIANSSNIENAYQISLAGEDIFLVAVATSKLFSSHAFSSTNATPPSTMGTAIFVPQKAGTGVLTSTIQGPSASSYPMVALVPGWPALMTSDSGALESIANRGYLEHNGTKLSLSGLLSLMSLNIYQSYNFYEMLFNTSLPPEIDFIGYARNSLIVNVGNLNLTGSDPVSLAVDGKALRSRRYFDWIIANVSLSIDLHNVSVQIGSGELRDSFYVSPYVGIYGPARIGNTLRLELGNPNQNTTNLEISGLNVSSIPPYFDSNPSLTNYAATITPFANSAGNVTLGANSTVTLNYTVADQYGSAGCPLGAPYLYYLSFNTSLGKAYYVLYGSCT